MNKFIKHKKYNKLKYKNAFSKTDRLLMKKFPKLFAVCTTYGIEYSIINRSYKRFKTKFGNSTKIVFEIAIRSYLVMQKDIKGYIAKPGSCGELYYDIGSQCVISPLNIISKVY